MAPASHDTQEPDWRQLASDRNIAHHVAHQLWLHAKAMSFNDMQHADRLFKHLLDEASHARGASHEPGRETLVDTKGVKDAASLGPGKTTLVEQDYQGKPNKPVKTRSVSADKLHLDLVAAADAYQELMEMLKHSDPATIREALRELQAVEGSDTVENLVKMAGGVVEKIFRQDLPGQKQTAPGDSNS